GILNLYKDLKVLVFSANPEEIVALPLYVKGIRGYLGKESDDEEIVAAIKSVLDGNIYISNRLKRHILKTSDSESMETLDTLTETELKIVTMLMQGRRVMEISAALNLKPSTISNSKKKIFQKLKVENVMQIQQLMFPKGQQWNK
ncbi:MAG: response regulator transcription factor, partial [Chitinophagaceae bacterium]